MITTLRLCDARSIEAQTDGFSAYVRVDVYNGGTLMIVANSWVAAQSIADAMRQAQRSYDADVTRAESLITSLVAEQDSSGANSPAR